MLTAYIASLPAAITEEMRIFRNRSGQFYTADTLGDDFRDVRNMVFPGDNRVLLDIRRTGAVEAVAGGVDPAALAAKMANTIDQNHALQKTYVPNKVQTVRLADKARHTPFPRAFDALGLAWADEIQPTCFGGIFGILVHAA